MERMKLVIVALLLLLSACDKAGTQSETIGAEDVAQGLIIVNNLAETLSIMDTHGTVHNNVQLTGTSPNAVLHDAPYIYIVNSLSNSILVLKDSDLSIVREISVGSGKNPMNATVIQSHRIAVTAFLAQTLEIVDIEAGKVIHSIDLSGIALPRDVADIGGRSYPYGVAVSNGRIFVTLANLTDHSGGLTAAGPGVVAVFDAGTYTSLGSIQLAGADPVAAQAYGGKVYIACAGHYNGDITTPQAAGFVGDGTVECIDADTLARAGSTYALTAAPFALTISGAGILYASNAMGGTIPRIDLATGDVEYLASGGSYITSVLAVDDTLYALDFSGDTLLVIDRNGTVQGRYTVGDGPIALLSLSDIASEGFITPVMNMYPSIAVPGTSITFDGSESLVSDSVTGCTWDFGDGTTASGWTVTHAYQDLGAYIVTFTITGGHGMETAAGTVRIVAVSPFASQMIAYDPAPGQFIDNPRYSNPLRALGPPVGGVSPYQPDNSSVVSLGGFGGSLMLAFDHEVQDNTGAMDFIVFGNAQYTQAPKRFIEPGIVEISEDGQTWFLIPGPLLSVPFTKVTKTYSDGLVFSAYQLPSDLQDSVVNGSYIVWGYADLSPTLTLSGGADPLAWFTNPDDPVTTGIDSGTPGGDAFDIAWAVDPLTGLPANLEGFRYIRITTAVDGSHGGTLGEFSTEVDAVADVGL